MKKQLCVFILLITVSLNLFAARESVTTRGLIANGFNEFAFELYLQEMQPQKNMIFSPYSLSSLLGILTLGAAENTRNQLIHLLHIVKVDENVLNKALADSMKSIFLNEGSKNFIIANAIWSENKFPYKKNFLDMLQNESFINFKTVGFTENPEIARMTVNNWVEKTTRHYIKNLLPQGSVTKETRLILTNAIFFKGLWQLQFKHENTKQESFLTFSGTPVKVSMMHQEGRFLYAENNLLQMLQLRYVNSHLAMAILLPKSNHLLKDVLKNLNATSFAELVSAASEKKINVSIPKFTIESTFSSLKKSIQRLGLTDAFTEKANFSNITNSPLMISDVVQKAMIKVDEEGTVAAAASGVMMNATAFEPNLIFNANHPFLYVIFDTQSGAILFIGQYGSPM